LDQRGRARLGRVALDQRAQPLLVVAARDLLEPLARKRSALRRSERGAPFQVRRELRLNGAKLLLREPLAVAAERHDDLVAKPRDPLLPGRIDARRQIERLAGLDLRER